MKQQEYLKAIEREIHRVNKIIDYKIIHGQDYFKEAHDHKLLLKKLRLHTQKSFFDRMFPSFVHIFS